MLQVLLSNALAIVAHGDQQVFALVRLVGVWWAGVIAADVDRDDSAAGVLAADSGSV